MANKYKGEVSLEVDGTQYTLRPSINALCEIETKSGQTVEQVSAAAERGDLRSVRLMVWSLLQACHKGEIPTEQEAGDWIDRAGGLLEVGARLAELTQLNQVVGAGASGRPPRARAQTGASSLLRRAGQA